MKTLFYNGEIELCKGSDILVFDVEWTQHRLYYPGNWNTPPEEVEIGEHFHINSAINCKADGSTESISQTDFSKYDQELKQYALEHADIE